MNDRILGRFSPFGVMGQNVYGVRRRHVESESEVIDPKKGFISRHCEIRPGGVMEHVKKPFEIYVTVAGTPHHVEHNFGYWHIDDMEELYLRFPGDTLDALGCGLIV